MKDVDFTACAFIKDELHFLTYRDFCKNAKLLKAYYSTLEKNAKQFYKWYVYANIHMNESFKNLVWSYLNSDDPEMYIVLIDALTNYKVK